MSIVANAWYIILPRNPRDISYCFSGCARVALKKKSSDSLTDRNILRTELVKTYMYFGKFVGTIKIQSYNFDIIYNNTES